MEEIFVVVKNGLFLGFGGYSAEYPEAEIFVSRGKAVAAAKKQGKGAEVICNYGDADESVIFKV